MAPSVPKSASPLVAAAAGVDEALRAYDDLAREAQRIPLNSEKGLQRAIRVVQESTERNEGIQEKLRALVAEMDAARVRQVESLNILLEASRALQTRAEQHDALEKRFAALGDSARSV